MLDEGYLLQGDRLMGDEGFNTEEEVDKCGLQLNIPPFPTTGKQMTKSGALLTKTQMLNIELMLREQSREFKDDMNS